ncbi:MAG: dockerin type I domain-containing protein [Candidatus Omnitrophota bacterium]
MKQGIRYYSYFILVCFLVNMLTVNVGLAFDLKAQQDMLMSDEVIQGIFGSQISEQSQSSDLNREIAPAPKVITTSNGDVYIYSDEGASAQVSKNETGHTEVTYSLNGAKIKIKNENTGEEFSYRYNLNGAQVSLYRIDENGNEALVSTQTFNNFGQLTSTAGQGKITYIYSQDNPDILVKSIDQWGNETIYDDQGRPDYIINYDSDGNQVQVGNYTFNSRGILETFVDYNKNVTHFENDGIRPSFTTNAQGTTTKTYTYDADGHLAQVTDEVNGQITIVEDGYYTVTYNVEPVMDEQGVPVLDANGDPVENTVLVGAYNYNAAGQLESMTNFGDEGTMMGWTEFDATGQISGAYNQHGVLIQEYFYNQFGFLEYTVALGALNNLTDQQVKTTYTIMDDQGRPKEVWQIGDGGNKVKIQEYEYGADGLLAATYSLGIMRGSDENNQTTYCQPINAQGNLATDESEYVYFRTSKTVFDRKGRPESVSAVCYQRDENDNFIVDANGAPVADRDEDGQIIYEKQQSYKYNSKGFLAETISYGFNGRITGKTVFDKFGRPEESSNGQGTLTQRYVYGDDGFLKKTINFGEDGVQTGHTLYDEKAKPTEVYNHAGTLVQKYVYDENGLMVMSLNLNGEDGLNGMLVSSMEDAELIAAMWDNSFDAEIIAVTGSFDNQALMNAMWENMESNPELAKKICLKVIQLFSDGAKGGDQNLINDVGTAYHMLGQFLEAEGDQAGAIAAYKVQGSEFTAAMAIGASGNPESVTAWSTDRLAQMNDGEGADTAVVTGYTIFGGDSKPMASYQCYNDGQNGLQVTKVQDFIYSYQTTERRLVGQDAEGKDVYVDIEVTRFSNSVQKTVNYGDNGAETGYTLFDDYGRQKATYNEEGQVTQKYTYSREGFLTLTKSYGVDGACTGATVFDKYSRPVASFNLAGSTVSIPDDLIAALSNGLTEADLENTQWQPYLKGLSQTFEYNAETGLMESSKSWGEAVEISAANIGNFADALGSIEGDKNYSVDYDFNSDGVINDADLAIFEAAFSGASNFVAAYGSTTGDANFDPSLDTNQDGVINRTDASGFSRTFSKPTKYQPTFTGTTSYDKYGKAVEVTNAEGSVVSRYAYNERGFMIRSDSFSLDEQGNEIRTGFTLFDDKSRPTETYSVYNNGSGEQAALAQVYFYKDGFLERTKNYGKEGTYTGETVFDKYGRQSVSYNEEGQKISSYSYSNQGFLKSTSNYGLEGAYLGKTVFDRKGRPAESYNMSGALTQKFNYNEATGFMQSSTSYGDLDEQGNPTLTQTTFYDGYGKAIRSENELGIVTTTFDYDAQGFMLKSNSLAFVEDPAAANAITITNKNAETLTGYYVVTGYTEYDNYSRPTTTYQGYWADEQTGVQTFSKVQEFTYDKGFLVSTESFGRNGVSTGTTTFDRYGRQDVSKNEYGEVTTKYRYSNRGFLSQTYNYGANGAITGSTTFNSLGRPVEAYNQNRKLVQTFEYNKSTGALLFSESYNYDDAGNQFKTQITTYDAFGKADKVYNTIEDINDIDQDGDTTELIKGYMVSSYHYDASGFMLKSFSYGEPDLAETPADGGEYRGPVTGFTIFGDSGRPEASYTVHNGNWDPLVLINFKSGDQLPAGVALSQVFIYNTDLAGTKDASAVENYLAGPREQNTGFVTLTVRYGDNQTFVEFTTMNRYGQQDTSYNNYSEKTTQFRYNSSGSLSQTYNYTFGGRISGKTYFNGMGRPVKAVNESGILVQTFNYNSATGFLTSTDTYGAPDAEGKQEVTQTTYYNAEGKQTHTTNPEGQTVSRFVYNERGFLTASENWAVDDNGVEVKIGYTEMSAETGRPIASYSVSSTGLAVKTADFIYSTGAITDNDAAQAYAAMSPAERDAVNDTGFVLGTISYIVNQNLTSETTNIANVYNPNAAKTIDPETGEVTAVDISSQILYNGYSVNDSYGRQLNSYNKEGSLISRNFYKQGFINKSMNYGEGGVQIGSLLYGTNGRPTIALNYRGEKVSEYLYNDKGFLAQTLSYSTGLDADGKTVVQVMTGYSNYDVFGKATESYQLFEVGEMGTPPPYAYDEDGYQFEAGGSKNYVVIPKEDGSGIAKVETINGTGLVSKNVYNEFGALLETQNYGREGGVITTVKMDLYSRPTIVYNHLNEKVQEYTYNKDTGFLSYTVSYYKKVNSNDEGEVEDGFSTEKETSVTFFNAYGQQSVSYLLNNEGEGFDGTLDTVGALQSKYQYNAQGFLYKTLMYNGTTMTGYTVNDASGRQITQFNASNEPTAYYWYNTNGFLLRMSNPTQE